MNETDGKKFIRRTGHQLVQNPTAVVVGRPKHAGVASRLTPTLQHGLGQSHRIARETGIEDRLAQFIAARGHTEGRIAIGFLVFNLRPQRRGQREAGDHSI